MPPNCSSVEGLWRWSMEKTKRDRIEDANEIIVTDVCLPTECNEGNIAGSLNIHVG